MGEQRKGPWVRFGRELRKARLQAGYTQEQLGDAIRVSHGLISAFERGTREPKPDHIRHIDSALSTSGTLIRIWETATTTTGLASWFQGVLHLEQRATTIRTYAPMVVPGLLQSAAYARTILRDGARTDTDAEIDDAVSARMDRQSLMMANHPPMLYFVLDEAVLLRSTGGREIMRDQLTRLVEVSELPHVIVQVVPMSTVHHPGLCEAYSLFTVPDMGDVVYMETLVSGTPIEDPEHRADYESLFADLRGTALPEPDSRVLIEKIRGDFE